MADVLLSKMDTDLLEQSNSVLVEASDDEVATEIDDGQWMVFPIIKANINVRFTPQKQTF
jgi:hypothetical protein